MSDLDDRLTDLFDRVGAAVRVEDDLERAIAWTSLEARRTVRRGGGWIAAAAAAVVAAIGTAGVVEFVDSGRDATIAESPAAPGPLYVLPRDRERWEPGAGHSESGQSGMLAGVTVGIPVDGAFLDAVPVWLTDTDPIDPADYDDLIKTTVRLPSGIAYLWTSDEGGATLVQRRDDDFLAAATWEGDTHGLSRAVDAVVILEGATLDVAPDSLLAVVDRIDRPWIGVGHSTYMEAAGAHRVVVETASFPVLVGMGGGSGASEVRRVAVNGAGAWITTRYDSDGTWLGLSFALEHGTVFLSGTVPEDVLIDLAENVEVVDEATWKAATGAD